jgi:putative hemolysin
MARNRQVFALKLSAKWVPRPLIEAARSILDRLMGFPEFNAIYAELPVCKAVDFSRTFLDAMQIRVTFAGLDPDVIPSTGPLIVVANHSFGFVEGLALDTLLLARRPDVTFLSVYVFAAIPELRERWIFVDPDRRSRNRNLNREGVRRSFEWVARGGVLAVFPAGRVARFSWRHMRTAEQPWSSRIAAVARETQTKVLPVYFHGHNGWFFQLVGMLHPGLQHLLFVREITNKRGRTLRATIGPLIEPAELVRFASDDDASQFLRQETEKLSQL